MIGRWKKTDSICKVNLNKNQLSLLSLETPKSEIWIQWQSPHQLDWKNASILNTKIFIKSQESANVLVLDLLRGNVLFSFGLHSPEMRLFGPSSEFIIQLDSKKSVLSVHSWKNPSQSLSQLQMDSFGSFYTSCEFGILILKKNHVSLRDFRNAEMLCEWMLPALTTAETCQVAVGRTKIMLFDSTQGVTLVLE